MKFSDFSKEEWSSLQPYMDTCLLPVSGLTGKEEPWAAAKALERLRDGLDLVEIPFKGRVVTYPAMQYQDEEQSAWQAVMNRVCTNLKAGRFKHVIVLTASPSVDLEGLTEADLCIRAAADSGTDLSELKSSISEKVQAMWRREP